MIQKDNRNYDYSSFENESRQDYDYLVDIVNSGSSVIDLGCGNGSLMQRMIKEKKVTASGVELSDSAVEVCLKKGLNVIHGKIDQPLPFKDNEFEFSVCNVTVQMVLYPEILIQEMKRISKYQVITFPNFAFYKNRLDLLLNGRMPKPMMFGYKWYSTGHLHQLSLKDFYEIINDIGGIQVERVVPTKSGNAYKDYLVKKFPNLFQALIIFVLSKK